MSRVTLSIVLAVVLIGGFLAFQATQTGTSLVLLPSELMALTKGESRTRIRVAGRVHADGVSYQVEPALRLEFFVRDPGKDEGHGLPVLYEGLKPDMFAGGRDVIIDGDFREGTLVASRLLTQCPSKYEPPKPGSEESLRKAQAPEESPFKLKKSLQTAAE